MEEFSASAWLPLPLCLPMVYCFLGIYTCGNIAVVPILKQLLTLSLIFLISLFSSLLSYPGCFFGRETLVASPLVTLVSLIYFILLYAGCQNPPACLLTQEWWNIVAQDLFLKVSKCGRVGSFSLGGFHGVPPIISLTIL